MLRSRVSRLLVRILVQRANDGLIVVDFCVFQIYRVRCPVESSVQHGSEIIGSTVSPCRIGGFSLPATV